MVRLAFKMLRGTFLGRFAKNHSNQSSRVLSVCSSSSRMSFAFAIKFQRNLIMDLSHLAVEDKVVSNIPVTGSWDIDYLLPADVDGGVVGGTEAGGSSL